MKSLTKILVIVGIAAVLLVFSGAIYTVDETKQVVITQFGKPIGAPITEAGLRFKTPFIQQATFFEKRLMVWDGHPNQIPTKDKKYIWVDTTARWKIVKPLKFLQTVHDETTAHARLDDIIDSATRDFVTSHNLVEIVRNSNRVIPIIKAAEEMVGTAEAIENVKLGREELTRAILKQAKEAVSRYGIELVDMRIKRINYVEQVRRKVYERMISERKRAAEKYRSEGQGKKAEIEGQKSKELQGIESKAYHKAQKIKGDADAVAIKIYAQAYNNDPEFYSFLQTLKSYEETIDKGSTIILTTDSDYYEYLKSLD